MVGMSPLPVFRALDTRSLSMSNEAKHSRGTMSWRNAYDRTSTYVRARACACVCACVRMTRRRKSAQSSGEGSESGGEEGTTQQTKGRTHVTGQGRTGNGRRGGGGGGDDDDDDDAAADYDSLLLHTLTTAV